MTTWLEQRRERLESEAAERMAERYRDELKYAKVLEPEVDEATELLNKLYDDPNSEQLSDREELESEPPSCMD